MPYPFDENNRLADPPWKVGSPLARVTAALLAMLALAAVYPVLVMWAFGLAFIADCLGGVDAKPTGVYIAGALAWGFGFAILLVAIVTLAKYARGMREPRTRTLSIIVGVCLLLSASPFIYVYGGFRDVPGSCEGLQM